jgi:outer membrane protein OmpA-like peptidoglycan-associated protein
MRRFQVLVALATVSLFLPVCGAQTKDAKGCTDSPLLSRFPDSIITGCRSADDDSFKFDMGDGKPQKVLEGKVQEIRYHFPSTASKAQVVRNLTTALRAAGYSFDLDTGGAGNYTAHMGKAWISVQVSVSGDYREVFVTETALTQDVVANAAALSTGLSGAGHVVINGILFDTGKADIKPESDAALAEVSKLLKGDPKLLVYVVGHTDNVGGLAANMDLSRRRAAAVSQLLTTKYGIPAAQLSPFGNGPYAPVASNDSEDGRAANRRVELVKQ